MTEPVVETPTPVRRSGLVTGIGLIMIVVGIVVLPISLISALMLMVQGDGSQSATLGGFISVVMLPPLAIVAGIGLWKRQRWAFWLAQGVLGWLIIGNLWHELTVPSGTIYTDASGAQTMVDTTDYSSSSLPIILVCLVALLALWCRQVRAEFFGSALVHGEQKMSNVSVSAPAVPSSSSVGSSVPFMMRRSESKSRRGFAAVIAALFSVSLFMGWQVNEGWRNGEVRSLARHGATNLNNRADDPGLYWFSMVLHGAIGIGTAALGVWLIVLVGSTRDRRSLGK